MSGPGRDAPRRRRELVLRLLLAVFAPLTVLALIEGYVSLGLAAYDFNRELDLRDPVRHTQYDSLLGWVTRPNLTLPDFFGPGVHLTTDAAGRRGRASPGAGKARGPVRVICSGDSYTFGLGVGDEESWCAVLARLDPRVEAINLGEIAYGLDQSFLRYVRDGMTLRGDVHILAFIWDDFRRMRGTRFLGFDKPVLTVEGGGVRPDNVPVPRLSSDMPRLADWLYSAQAAVRGLRSARVVARIRSASRPETAEPDEADPLAAIMDRMLGALDSINRAQGTRFVLVHFPTERDSVTPEAAVWRARLPGIVERRRLDYVDLEGDYRALADDERRRLTSPLHGHYSPSGQAWAAERILAHLRPRLEGSESGAARPTASRP